MCILSAFSSATFGACFPFSANEEFHKDRAGDIAIYVAVAGLVNMFKEFLLPVWDRQCETGQDRDQI